MFRLPQTNLRCSRAREWVGLSMDEELDEVQRVRLAAHLADCPDCRRHESILRQGREALRGQMAEPSENFEWKVQLGIQRALRERAAGAEAPRASFWRPALASAAAVALLVVGAGALWLGAEGPAVPGTGPVPASPTLARTSGDTEPAQPDLSGGVRGRVFEIDATREGFGIRTVSRTTSDPRFTGDLYGPVRPRSSASLRGLVGRGTEGLPEGIPTREGVLYHEWRIGEDGVPVLNLRLRGSTVPARDASDAGRRAAAESTLSRTTSPR